MKTIVHLSISNTLLLHTASGVVIGFDSMASYTTTETEGEVSVCVSVIDSFERGYLHVFEVILLTQNGKPKGNLQLNFDGKLI